MGELHRMSNSAVPIAREQAEQMLEALATMQRETTIMAGWLIERLNHVDGDADLEADRVEDDFFPASVFASIDTGPGCDIADPDFGADDEGEAIDEREADHGDFDSGKPIEGGGSGDY